MADLKKKSVRGGMVTMVSQGVSIGIQLTSTVVLARLLSPEDYGVIAMVMAIVSFAVLFRDLGLSSAAIQKKNLTHAQQSNLFWLNVAMGVLLTILVASVSPLVVWFYGKPELLWVTVALSFSFLINSLGSQHRARLLRDMQFGRQAVATIAGALLTLITAVPFALQGFSYWALVWANLAGAFATTLALFGLSRFHPSRYQQGAGIREMLRFGANITAFNLVNYFARNLDNVLIGRFAGASSLGLYSRAYQLMMFPVNAIRGPVESVAYSTMSKIDPQSVAFRNYYITLARFVASLSMPLIAWLFITADEIVEIALGGEWSGVVPLFRYLAFAAFMQPTSSLRGLLMTASGQAGRHLKGGVISSLVVCAAFLVGIRWGAEGVAVAYACVVLGISYPMHRFSVVGTSVRVEDYLKIIVMPAVYAICVGVVSFGLLMLVGTNSLWLKFIVAGFPFLVAYAVLWRTNIGPVLRGMEFSRKKGN